MHRRSVRAISQRLFRPVHALAPFTASSRLFNPFHASYTTQRAFIHYKTTHNYEYTPQEGRILKGEFGDLKRDSKAEQRLIWDNAKDPFNNLTPNILEKIGANLHLQKHHPLNIIKTRIENYFGENQKIWVFDDLCPIMDSKKAFDELLIPPEHPGRSPTDTYYFNKDLLLRPHTSAHQNEILRQGVTTFLCTGDVYRRDTIDATHSPVFHQMEGLHLFEHHFLVQVGYAKDQVNYVVKHMKNTLEGLCTALFGPVQFRWIDEYFPFTDPSFELEIFFNGEWMEVLGCGVVHEQILKNCKLHSRKGWAFGLGLERLAMILFQIPDIRLFWSRDKRFLSQFTSDEIVHFKPYSKFPPCYKDITFWIPRGFHDNAFYDLIRNVAGEMVENVNAVDRFTHPTTKRQSICFRINYRSMDRNLTNEEVNRLQEIVRVRVVEELGVELR